MRRPFGILSIIAWTLAAAAPASRAQEPDDQEFARRADALVRSFADARCFSGSVLVARGGRVLLSKGYGEADAERHVPNAPDTRFHIASVSKTFTAAAVMMLAERGLLSPADLVSKHVPDYPRGDEITVEQLLTHRSGIPNINDFGEYEMLSRFPQTPERLVREFRDKPLIMRPGERYSYSNSNYNLLAWILERRSGKAYGDVLRESLLEPLGLKDTGHDGRAADLIPRRALGYAPAGVDALENAPYLDWSSKTGNGSLYSTTGDLYRWDRALRGGQILSADSRAEIFRDHGDGVGYGWFVGRRAGRNVVRMSGRSPGYQAEIQRFADDDACVIVLSNLYSGTASLLADDLSALLFGAPAGEGPAGGVAKVDAETAAALTGTYRGGKDFVRPGATLRVRAEDGVLRLDWGGGYVSALIPLDGGGYLDRLFGGRVFFEREGDGPAAKLLWRSGGRDQPAERVADRP